MKELVDSIREIGLINPISVNKQNKLLAGLHRLRACEEIGFDDIDCIIIDSQDIDAELVEIEENIIRNDLNVIERAEHMKRRKEIYELKYPKAEKTFTQDVSEKTGVSKRSIETDIQIANNLTPEVKEKIKNSDLANKKVELTELARLEPEQQEKFVKEYEQGKIEKVVEILDKDLDSESLIEREFETFKKELSKLVTKFLVNHLVFIKRRR